MEEVKHPIFIAVFPVILLFIVIFSFIFVIAGPYLQELPVQNCSAENAEAASGTWSSPCDNTYPGTALFYDDGIYEIHQIRKGTINYWAGLRINSSNTSITDCAMIDGVKFCYKWWSETNYVSNCDISVDSNGGLSYTAINTTCPGTTEPGNITCKDITSLENWTCNNFFGSFGALAKSEARHSGGGAPAYFNITWDVFYFNVSYSPDTFAPTFLNLENQSIEIGDSLSYDINADDISSIDCFSVNDTSNFKINCSGYLTNATALNIGLYWLNISVNDTLGNVGHGIIFVNVSNITIYPVNIENLVPIQGSEFNLSDTIELRANVTSDNMVDSVYVEVVYPDSSVEIVDLSGTGDWYSSSFTIPDDIFGRYNLNFYANDSLGLSNNKSTFFNAKDPVYPTIVSISISKTLLFTAQKNKLSMEAADNLGVDSCWVNITLPDSSTDIVPLSCSGAEIHYANTVPFGIYIVSFYVNDTFGNINSTQGSFEILSKVDFEYDVLLVNTSDIINLTITNPEDGTIVYENDSTVIETIGLPDAVLDFEFRAYDNRFKTKLRSINITADNNKSFGMDKHSLDTNHLVTYAINNSYNFSNATLTIYYDDLTYSDDSNLELYKCDNYDFAARSCLSSWYKITASQNTIEHYFEFTTTSFSGFSIKEYTAPVVEDSTPVTSSSGGASSGGGGTPSVWNCGEWSECIGNKQTRECSRGEVTQIIERDCAPINLTDITIEEKIQKKLFDITLIADETLLEESAALRAIVLLENFEAEPISLDINLTVLNEQGKVALNEIDTVTVEDFLWREYSSIEQLADGKYTIILEAIFNSTIKEIASKEIQIGPEKGFLSRSRQIFKDYNLLNWIYITGVIMVIAITLSYLYFSRKAYKERFKKKKDK